MKNSYVSNDWDLLDTYSLDNFVLLTINKTVHKSQRQTRGVYPYHCLLYFLETGSVTETESPIFWLGWLHNAFPCSTYLCPPMLGLQAHTAMHGILFF